MSRDYVLGAKELVEEDLLVEATIRDEVLMTEKVFIELWNAVSEFHADLVQPMPQEPCGSEPDSDEDDDLPLTEEERAFHTKFVAESGAQLAIRLAKERTKGVNKFTRNAFLPIAPPRWIESEAKSLGDKVWEFETFNHLAPISVNAYRPLASLTEEEVNLCQEGALNENTKCRDVACKDDNDRYVALTGSGQERVFGSDVRPLLWQRTAGGASSALRGFGSAGGLSSGRVFGGCGRRHAAEAERFSEMDFLGCGQGLREVEIDAVAMAVTAVVVNMMSGMSSSSRDMLTQLRKRRAQLQSIAEAPDCVATCEAVIHLCAALSSGVFPLQTPRWRIRRRTGGTWEDLLLCDDAMDEYYHQKLRMSMAMFRQIIAACAAYMEKKVTHYRMPLQVEQVIAFALYRHAEAGELFDAPPENLPHGVFTRGYLLGNNGYPVACPWIVQPYGGIDQDPNEERFDTRQKVAWGCVERAFGWLKWMWRMFLRTHKTNLDTLPQQFVAVCTLHNILLDAGIDFDENLLWEVDENDVRRRVDLGIVGNSAGGWRRSTNVDGDLLWDALRDLLALM
ncbi:hypothetical protein CBR_g17761 [Chara braunii]|uniref:DDE Tnp4 domain-containing protein n=1 Tax=Chara braunii TaxID=69332 RepID=A0A388KVH7_CHABU|nr:hypothetical protein CBR_g17761 [Chara braunii]|eukprot:GBG74051.1 hypothetical protein CBR_g17761 [Chara braunii]